MFKGTKLNLLKDKKIILFGASKFGKNILNYLIKQGIKIDYFSDNDRNKWDTKVENVLVIPPEKIKNIDYDFIIITSMYLDEIYNQLISLQAPEDKILFIPFISEITENNKKEIAPINKIGLDLTEEDRKKTEFNFNKNKVNFNKQEKIRICFLFQVASFWPSWDSFWNACKNDDRIEVKMMLFDETIVEKSQMKTARKFLEKLDIEYLEANETNIDNFNPHIIVVQTPYDVEHRPTFLYTNQLRRKGYRIVYIPYGIEISDTIESRKKHFLNNVVLNAWRIYTFSEKMKQDYIKYEKTNQNKVYALGHPKFDNLFDIQDSSIRDVILEKANGRKIVLWKVHFPKAFRLSNCERVICTPYLLEYYKFAKKISEYEDMYFIFMPHPKFFEMCAYIVDGLLGIKIREILKQLDNVYIYEHDDYRPGLLLADYIMVDRSAIMVEAGMTNKPILYLENSDYQEPVTDAIKPLINSYYRGTGCKDMIEFIEMCRKDIDPNKKERIKAFNQCVPFTDGKSGFRIKEHIVNSLFEE